jgi:hypothetical protein
VLPLPYLVSIVCAFLALVVFPLEQKGRTGTWPGVTDWLAVGVAVLAAVQAIQTGFNMTFNPNVNITVEQRVYAFFGGAALFGLAIQELYKKYKGK